MSNFLNPIFQNAFDSLLINQIGLTLLHCIWQIAFVTLLFAALRSFLQWRKCSSSSTYWLGMLTLLVSMAMPVSTFCLIGPRPDSETVAMTLLPETREAIAREMVPGSSESRFLLLPSPNEKVAAVTVQPSEIGRSQLPSEIASESLWAIADVLPNHSLFWLALVWIIGTILFSMRTLIGFVHMDSLRSSCSKKLTKPISNIVRGALNRFPVAMNVEFAISKRVFVPTVVGILRPIVLLPASVLTELTPEQLELIIVHELAHIKRRDMLFNLLQTVIESLLFFHPCVWWVSSIVRAERENCCDDAAVRQADAASYANALLKLEMSRPSPALAMAADGGDLLTRIQRLAGKGKQRSHFDASASPWFAGMICMTILVGLLVSPNVNSIAAQDSLQDRAASKVTKDFAKTTLGKVLDREMDKLEKVGFSGSVLVAHKGEIILARSEGFSDARKKKNTRPTTLYEIASTSKSFTSTAAMILAQRGKLDVDASIADYLPNVPEESRKIKVLDLLLHESGIPATSFGDTSKDLSTAVETMLAGGPRNDPGTKFEYWNGGYILLSEIVSKAAGKPFKDFVREEIFEPCDMSGTCFTGDPKPKGYLESTGSGELGPSRSCLDHPYGKMELVYQGTGGIVSNVVDMWKFHRALQEEELLDDEFKELMFEKGVSNYACGWYVMTATNGDSKHFHAGKVRGFCSDFRRFPETDSCIVVLSNSDSAPASTVANVLEGLLLPAKVLGANLDADTEKKIVGEYRDSKDRFLIVMAGDRGMPTHYMIYWQPKNPSAPISRGTVRQTEAGEIVFYQPGDSNVVEIEFSADKSKVDSVQYSDLDMKFERFDIKAWSDAQKK